jgi:hypothetical protein
MRKLMSVMLLMLTVTTLWAQTADEIIDKYIAAIGGKQKWLSLHSIIQEGVLKTSGIDIPIKFYQTHDKGARQELNVNGPHWL